MAVTSRPRESGAEAGAAEPREAAKAPRGDRGEAVFNGFSHLFLLVWALMVVYPLAWVVLSSFKDDSQIIKQPLSLIPHGLHWDNFVRAWGKGHIGAFFLNTVI